jgi:hypothetical protein
VAVVQNVMLIGGIIAAFWLASWWPFILGTVSSVVLPLLLKWGSPLIVVTPQEVVAARRHRALTLFLIVAVVLIAGIFYS